MREPLFLSTYSLSLSLFLYLLKTCTFSPELKFLLYFDALTLDSNPPPIESELFAIDLVYNFSTKHNF